MKRLCALAATALVAAASTIQAQDAPKKLYVEGGAVIMSDLMSLDRWLHERAS